ncbi:MAG: serine hydrolase [Planctomycetota bacterium]|nr:serine hydrolase [Planctomycetota bacterium]
MRILPKLQLSLALLSLVALPFVQDPTEVPPPAATEAATAASIDPAVLAERIDALLAEHHALDQFSGTALVAEGGEVIYRGAFGEANSDWGIPNAVDTKFRLASVTKQFTAMLTLLLVEEGKLELEAPITRYLPDYPAASGDKVTIRQLLNHTSGIPSYTNLPGFMRVEAKGRYTVDEFVVEFCSGELEFEPGSAFNYNNSGYFLLGAISEAVTGRTYRDNLRTRIFDPLGMADTGFDDQYEVLPKRATGYDDLLGGRRVALWLDMSTPYAAGSLYSTVGDLWRWDRALCEQRLLDGELEAAMFTPGLGDYGFGWGIELEEPGEGVAAAGPQRGPVISHSGGMPGVSTEIWRMPDLGRTVILLCNSSSSAVAAARIGINRILDDGEPWTPTRRGDYAVAFKVLDEGPEAALELLASLPQIVQDEYIERDVNGLGYGLLDQRRFDEAIQVFEFLTTAYPESANTWDSLGEGHLRAGHRELAIECYRKALELDPASETARDALDKLAVLEASE